MSNNEIKTEIRNYRKEEKVENRIGVDLSKVLDANGKVTIEQVRDFLVYNGFEDALKVFNEQIKK